MTGFVIEFIIQRVPISEDKYLLNTYNDTKGLSLRTSRSFADSRVSLYLFADGCTNTEASSNIDENPHHIAFEVSPTHMTMVVDGIAGTPVEHSFVPSGLSFDASTQLGPKGQLGMFKMWYGSNYAKYDREKSASLGAKKVLEMSS